MDKENQKQVWEDIAEKWAKYRQKAPVEVETFLENKTGNILDLGCGSGRCFIKNNHQKLYAVDFSKEMLKFARRTARKKKIKIKLIEVESHNLPFKDNFFDGIICISLLHCIPNEKSRVRTIKEIYRVLKPEAEAMISVWKKVKSKTTEWKKDGKKYNRRHYFYKERELLEILKKSGFKILNKAVKNSKSLIGKHSRKNIIVYVRKP
jgi:ubiquinone/menaquinone biosynthesis C-methylase UbiE